MGTVCRKRLVAIDNREYPRAERNLLALQTARVSCAVISLVMVFDYWNDFVGELDVAQNVSSNYRMDHHLRIFGGGQLAGLAQDVFGNCQLAYVVKQDGIFQPHHLVLAVDHIATDTLCQPS